ncbi:hypothetical protein ACVWYO_001199 [Sphingomonas sp. UYP23]
MDVKASHDRKDKRLYWLAVYGLLALDGEQDSGRSIDRRCR